MVYALNACRRFLDFCLALHLHEMKVLALREIKGKYFLKEKGSLTFNSPMLTNNIYIEQLYF